MRTLARVYARKLAEECGRRDPETPAEVLVAEFAGHLRTALPTACMNRPDAGVGLIRLLMANLDYTASQVSLLDGSAW